MSSTYSSDLRIQLMGPGDQAGTWGSTTNNNFQYIFEQAIAGLQVVSVTTTPQALTYLNGATPTLANNQAICAVLQLSNGGVGANFTLTTPSGAQKTYVVFNNTAYVATMQVTGSSGNTIAIPAGVTTTVYTDGTNFYAGSTGTVGNFSVNGALSATGSVTASNHIGAGTGLTGTATSLSIGGNAATATSATSATTAGTCTGNAATATNPASGGSFITSNNIGSQSVSYANSAGSASTATSATTATTAGTCTGNAATATNPASGGSFITSSNIGGQSVSYASSAGSASTATTASNVSGGYVSSVNGAQGAVTLSQLGFAGQSLANPGYYKFPNGLIVQWASQLSWATQSFPIAFSTILCATAVRYSGSGSIGEFGITYTTTTITPGTNGNTTLWNYIALGY